MDRDRFVALWRRCGHDSAPLDGADVYRELEARYAEPHRYYHTGGHIIHCLRQMDLARSALEVNLDTVEMALWFHDAIYDVDRDDNERRSAQWFSRLAAPTLAPSLVAAVERLIIVTEHAESPRGADERYLVDVDLSSFGLPWPEFRRDSVAVRREFPAISDAQFAARQIGFLRSLIERPSLYSTDFYRERYEHQARSNIGRHIALLDTGNGLS